MKQILLILLLFVLGAMLCADTYDEALDSVFQTGGLDTVNGKTCWVPKGILGTEAEAVDYVAWACMFFFYTWAEWDTPSNSTRVRQINSIQDVGAYWYDDDIIYMVSIPKSEIVENFDKEKYYDYDPDDLYDAITTYVNYYGDVSAF